MRKLVVCLDGTGNSIGDRETNVLKIYKALKQSKEQKVHYVMGVGTNDGQNILGQISQKVRGVLGLAFGLGLEDDVLEAYRFLCRNYRTKHQNENADREIASGTGENDNIYVFGFSRGAYAARVLAGFIHNFGLVAPDKLYLIPAVFRAYRTIPDHKKNTDANKVFQALREYEAVLKPNRAIPIRCLGLFDTVSSMVRFRRIPKNLWEHGSLIEMGTHTSVDNNCSVRIVLHAMAVDERRSMFRPQFWRAAETTLPDGSYGPVYFGNRFKHKDKKRRQYVHQCWFPGYHSDVGGSPPEDRSGIGKRAVLWMLDKLSEAEVDADREDIKVLRSLGKALPSDRATRRHGLAFHKGHIKRYLKGSHTTPTPGGLPYCGPDALAPIHNSVWGNRRPQGIWFWSLLEVAPKSRGRRADGSPRFFRRALGWWYLPLFEPRYIPDDHRIDESVAERIKRIGHYRPPNVPKKYIDAALNDKSP